MLSTSGQRHKDLPALHCTGEEKSLATQHQALLSATLGAKKPLERFRGNLAAGLAQANGLGASTRCLCCIWKSMLKSVCGSVRSLAAEPA